MGDPSPFDESTSQIVEKVQEWLRRVTDPCWFVEVLHLVGDVSRSSSTKELSADRGAFSNIVPLPEVEERERLEEMSTFRYPIPLRLRDMQALIRPFMEVRSTHYISGLDAVVGEVVRAFLKLYRTVKAWEQALVSEVQQLAEASGKQRVDAICSLGATMELDAFELSHRLHHVDSTRFPLAKEELKAAVAQFRVHEDSRTLIGPPTAEVDQDIGGLSLAGQRMITRLSGDGCGAQEDEAHVKAERKVRSEAVRWWQEQGFEGAAPTNVLSSALLRSLTDSGLHPDPFVNSALPVVLEKLHGVQMSQRTFLNRFLVLLGGFVDSFGETVFAGQGFPLYTNPSRCAESILSFLRQWSSSCEAFEDSMSDRSVWTARRGACGVGKSIRGTLFDMDGCLASLMNPGHDIDDVVDLLNGCKPIRDSVLNVPNGEPFHVDEKRKRAWELSVNHHEELEERLDSHHRDMGPYVDVDLTHAEKLEVAWGSKQGSPRKMPAFPVPLLPKRMSYTIENDGIAYADEFVTCNRMSVADTQETVSELFGLKLIDWPKELGSGSSARSTFVKCFSELNRIISRYHVAGLPRLPWSFGSDGRNSLVVDVPGEGLAAFHCLFARSKVQPKRTSVIPLGSSVTPTYIVCPKYQMVHVLNGARVVCHNWTFELRITSKGLHSSSLSILTDEGEVFDVPRDGCHVGAGNRSRQFDHQAAFPQTKFVLKKRLQGISCVHFALSYHSALNRWTLVDHSSAPFGTLLLLKTSMAYPLSEGLRVKIGPVVLESTYLVG